MRLKNTIGFILFLFFSCILASSVSAATAYDMATTSNWNIRFNGAEVADKLGRFDSISVADVDSDGVQDFIVGAERADNNGRVDSGSLYYINGTLFNSLTGSGNTVDLSDPSNYTIRYDGPTADDRFGYATAKIADLNNNGKPDILVTAFNANNNGKSASGSFYVIYDSLIDDYSGTGHNVDMSEETNYNLRFDGASANDQIGTYSFVADMDNNNKNDLILHSVKTDYNGRTNAGSLWIIYDDLLDNYSGVGNNIDMSVAANYNLRYDGAMASAIIGDPDIGSADIDNDSKQDLLIGSVTSAIESRTDSGALYVIYNTLLDDYSDVGNNIDLADSDNYNLLFYGAANEKVAVPPSVSDDIDGDGKTDLVIGGQGADYNSRNNSGSFYLIYGNQLPNYTAVGQNIDMTNPANYNIRFDGAMETSGLSYHYIATLDVDNDGLLDIVSNSITESNNSRTYSGSLYVFYNSIFSGYSDTGNTIDTADNYSIRYDGATDLINFPGGDSMRFIDLNNDGKKDLIAGAAYGYTADLSERDAGYVYIIYNFPHTISVNSVSSFQAQTSVNITGTVNAANSVTNISNVQYSLDNGTFAGGSGGWTNCTPSDGSFNSTGESFSCALSGLSEGAHSVYLRAYDTNTSYTAVSQYSTVSFTTDTTSPKLEWTSTTGGIEKTVKFVAYAIDDSIVSLVNSSNLYNTNELPTFIFNKSQDQTSAIDRYQVLLYSSSQGAWVVYIDNIQPSSPGQTQATVDKIRDETDKYMEYINDLNQIKVRSKREIDKLTPGAYKYKVRVVDKAGNYRDSNEYILRVKTYQAVFSNSNQGWFPLTILSLGNINTNISSYDSSSYPTSPIAIPSSIFSFYGIAPTESKVTVVIKDPKEINNSSEIIRRETIANSESRFGINIDSSDNLTSDKEYTVNLISTNSQGDYVEIPEFKLKVQSFKATSDTHQTQANPIKLTTSPTTTTTYKTTNRPSSPTPTPSSQKHCFLFVCW